jgi:hypothetical protein
MTSREKVVARVRLGWALVAAGVLVGVTGAITELMYTGPYNARILTGFGILLMGVGAGYLMRYRAALKDRDSARRVAAEVDDERVVMIRTRAGNRAFWVSTAFVYAGLTWSSFAANGGLPPLEGDTLWYFLAAATLVPFAVYVGSMFRDERTL